MPNQSIQIKSITSAKVWDDFVLSHSDANFLSSHNWGQFHQRLEQPVFYQGFYKGNRLVGVALFIKELAKRGNYLTVAGGPILDWQSTELASAFASYAKKLAQKENCHFVRVRPQLTDSPNNRRLFSSLGFHLAPIHLTADLTWQLNLQPHESELLAQMRKSTRYEINKAKKLGVRVIESTDPADIKAFHAHQLNLAKLHNFVPFSYNFLYQQFSVFAASKQAALYHAYHQDTFLASAFVIFFGPEAVYHYAVSSPDNRRFPGSHAALWHAILEAKKRGHQRFNFWGIAPDNKPNHRFASLNTFKQGFGGFQHAYLPAHDLPTSPYYRLIQVFEIFRAKIRRL